jgi:hypothetical protein
MDRTKKESKRPTKKASKKATKKGARKRPVKSSSGGGGRKIPRGKTGKSYSGNFEAYIAYTHLEISMMSEIVDGFKLMKEYAIIAYEDLANIKFDRKPRLNIRYVATGNSITFKFGGSFVPKITLKDGDIIISVHKSIFFSSFVVYFMFKAYDAYLDTRIKQVDLQIKKIELNEKTEEARHKTNKKEELQKSLFDFFDSVRTNEDITTFKVNNVRLK